VACNVPALSTNAPLGREYPDEFVNRCCVPQVLPPSLLARTYNSPVSTTSVQITNTLFAPAATMGTTAVAVCETTTGVAHESPLVVERL